MECRILQKKMCTIHQYYSESHQAIDLVGENNTLDYILAHSNGKIIEIQDNVSNIKGSVGKLSLGNYIKIDHQNGYQTLYTHMRNGLNLRKNQNIEKGQVIGYIGDSGNAYLKHLHFEVWKDNKRINPLEFLNKDFPLNNKASNLKYNIGDSVEINGVYISSTSKEKLRPLVTKGKITKIIENAINPYLLDDGRIGWVNDNTIVSKSPNTDRNLSNKNYKGFSIVDALKEINIDSSYQYRKELAILNNINNYSGTTLQNTEMLNLLKQGLLKY